MKSPIEILFYLDNTDVAIIEVRLNRERENADNFDADWLAYHKQYGAINRFRFISQTLESESEEEDLETEEKGVLKTIKNTGIHIVVIGEQTFSFKKRPPELLPKLALKRIEQYINP